MDAGSTRREKRHDDARRLLSYGIDPSAARKARKRAEYIEQHDAFEAIAREWFARQAHSTRIIRASIRGDQTESLIAANPAKPPTPKSSSIPVDGSGAATAIM